MKRNGFVLAETLVVVIFVLIIFTLMYNSAIPLLARYDEISLYDDLDTTYDVYQYRRLVEASDNALGVVSNHYKKVSCADFSSETNRCNSLDEYLNVTDKDTLLYINTDYLNEVANDENIREEIRDYLNYEKIDPDKCIMLMDHDGHISYMDFTEYSITYNNLDLRGVENPNNRTYYYIGTETFTLINPTRRGYNFIGWTGSNGDTLNLTITIPQGSKGNRIYNANWEPIIYNINYNMNEGYEGSNCANQGGTCTFSGKKIIYYGANHAYNSKIATNSIGCTDSVFGDPAVGYSKACYKGNNPVTYTIESEDFTLTNPAKTGYTFVGWSGTDLSGTNNKNVTIAQDSIGDRSYTANWIANELNFSGKTINRTYGDATSSVSFTGASNGTGSYNYTEKGGTAASYASVSGTTITIDSSIPAGSYTYIVTATDNYSRAVKDATFTINVAKAATSITCNSPQIYTGEAIQSYSLVSSGCSSITNGSVVDAGTHTVTCNGDSNHNSSSCDFTVMYINWTWKAFYHNTHGYNNPYTNLSQLIRCYERKSTDCPNEEDGLTKSCQNNCKSYCEARGFAHWYCNDYLRTTPLTGKKAGAHCWCGNV